MGVILSWLQQYLEYTSAQESPEEFHLFCGLATLAAVMNRRAWLPRISTDGIERYRIYPGQLAVVLVAGSGSAHKSTAIGIAHEFMKAADVRLFDGKISHERLLRKLGSFPDKRAVLTVIASELETFISRSSYHDGFIGSLNKLFDCVPDTYETIKGGTVPLKDISLTVLAGTTPTSVGNALPPQASEQGFQSRYLWPYAERSGKVDPLTTDPTRLDPALIRKSFQLKTDLIAGLKRISQLQGEFRLSPDAKDWYDQWYAGYSASDEMSKHGWPVRRGDHMSRVALLLEASATEQPEISDGSLIAADGILEKYVERNFAKSFAFIGRHASADQQEHILDVFRAMPNGNHIELSEVAFRTRRFFKNATELHDTMQFLARAGMLKLDGVGRTGDEMWRLIKDDK